MTEKILDIVQIIEKNPISRLSTDYQNKLLNKIKEKFSQKEQQLFVSSFYCYLNYNSKNDFIIDLNDIWKWIGFSRKDPAKRLLEKFFITNIDYKIVSHQPVENTKGGRPVEKILLTINTFKKFCLKADTKKADEIHDYYIKLEELLQETINEETTELRNQLSIKDKEIVNINQNIKQQEKINKQNILIEKLKSKNCVYIGEIEENKFIKIGSSKNINARKKQLKKLFGNFIFLDIFECDNYREIEENILNDSTIKKYLYNGKINNHQSEEVVKLEENFNFEHLMTIVNKYINQIYFLTPTQLLEKQKLDLEKEKLEYNLLINIINNNQYSDIIKNIIDDKLPSILTNISTNIHNKQL
jgi:phage anti-repressor protein